MITNADVTRKDELNKITLLCKTIGGDPERRSSEEYQFFAGGGGVRVVA